MKINVEQQENLVSIRIEGIVKSIVDSQNIQDTLNAFTPEHTIGITVADSFSLTSTTIGYLLKKIQQDGFSIRITVHNKRLWDLLEHLNLTGPLNVTYVAG